VLKHDRAMRIREDVFDQPVSAISSLLN
jgi:hypothetical protein